MQAVLMQQGRLWVDEIDTPQPASGEVLVKSIACGICGSDLHAAQHNQSFVQTSREVGGAFQLTTYDPVVMGHEFCAEVVDFGPHTQRRLKRGQLVCSVPMLARSQPCAVGYSTQAPGGFGEYMVLSEKLLLPVPAGVAASAAALTEPMAVGLHAVNKAQLQDRDSAIVIGAGPVGLAVIANLKARGVAPIVAADFSAARRAFAAQQGADVVCDPRIEDPFAHTDVRHREGQVVFECVGVRGDHR